MLHHPDSPTVTDYVNLDTVVLFRRHTALMTDGWEPEKTITIVTAAVTSIGGSVYGQKQYTVGETSHPGEYALVEAWLKRHVAQPPQPRNAQGQFQAHE
jgi:hypothetical protein